MKKELSTRMNSYLANIAAAAVEELGIAGMSVKQVLDIFQAESRICKKINPEAVGAAYGVTEKGRILFAGVMVERICEDCLETEESSQIMNVQGTK